MGVRSSSLLILGAFSPELEPLKALVSPEEPGYLHFAETGVGLTRAALKTAQAIEERRSRSEEVHVLFVGTVGALNEKSTIGALVNITAVSLADAAIARGEGYLPPMVSREFAANSELSDEILSAFSEGSQLTGRAYTTTSITSDSHLAALLAKATNAEYENLELFGVALACAELGVSWNALCPITNIIGPLGQQSWKANHEAASKNLATFFHDRLLKRLAKRFL